MVKLAINQEVVNGMRKAKNELLMEELTNSTDFDIKEKLPYSKTQNIRSSYARIIEGLAIGLSVEVSELENRLDSFGLGSHDLKHLLQYNTAMQLYKTAEKEKLKIITDNALLLKLFMLE